jgi:hypothetical protein
MRSTSVFSSLIYLYIKACTFLNRVISLFSSLFLVYANNYKLFFSLNMLSISTAPLFWVNDSSYILIFFFNSSFSSLSWSPTNADSDKMENEVCDLSLFVRSSSSWSLNVLIAYTILSFSEISCKLNVNGIWILHPKLFTFCFYLIVSDTVYYYSIAYLQFLLWAFPARQAS